MAIAIADLWKILTFIAVILFLEALFYGDEIYIEAFEHERGEIIASPYDFISYLNYFWLLLTIDVPFLPRLIRFSIGFVLWGCIAFTMFTISLELAHLIRGG